jgi:uncharacterized membrane protein
MPTSSEIRARARASLKGIWGRSAGYLLLYYVVIGVPLSLLNLIPIVGYIVSFLTTGALTYGLYNYYLDISRGEHPSFSSFFSGFNHFGRTFLLYLLSTIFFLLWYLLFIVPGIIALLRYSQAYYILRDNSEISALEAIRRSKAMMIGHKGRLFVLGLTFIGWILLACLTVGIGFLWLYPYMRTAFSHFHQDLKDRSMPAPPPIPGGPAYSV